MRIVLLISVIFITCNFYKQIELETKAWSKNNYLTWEDFSGKVNPNSIYKANTNYIIYANYKKEKDTAIIEIKTLFNKINSWAKTSDTTKSLLKHEQGHFDIAEIYARRIRQKISLAVNKREINRNYVVAVKDSFRLLCSKHQALYDTETDHSKIKPKQLEWEKKISKELKDLEAYSSTELKMLFNK